MSRAYLDFDLVIEHAVQGYRVKVLGSPTGQAAADFSFPLSSLEMENFLLRLTRSLSEARRRIRRLESQERELVKGFGGQLFQAMFSGAVLGALQSSLNEAFRKDAGLRIRLRLTDTPELADVPWEFLFNPAANRFLSLTPDTPLVRYLDLPMPVRPLAVTPPIRVLVMISSPADFPQLDVGAEWDRLNSALGDLVNRGLVTITRLPTASLAGLQRPLRLDEYHIFHFIGHGGFDEHSQDGALALEDAHGRARLVSGQDLGVMLSGHRSLRLIVLNACEGARASSSDPFAGVAQSLVQQGIPAVIAMQFEISDEAAITFSAELYAAIADGYPIDAALAESRRAIFASGNDVEWATPVLHMRSPNGQLFRVTQRPVESEAERQVKEQAEREAAERQVKEHAEREAAERQVKEQAEREAAERQAAEQTAERQVKEQAERKAKERQVKEQAERKAKEQAKREAVKRPPATSRKFAIMALAAGALMLVGLVVPAFEVSGTSYSYADLPLLSTDLIAGISIALICGALLFGGRGKESFRLKGLLAGVGLEQVGAQLGVILGFGESNTILWGAFICLVGAGLLLWTSAVWFHRQGRHEPRPGVPARFNPASRAVVGLGGVLFFAAQFIKDPVNTNVPLLTIPLAVVTLAVALFVSLRRRGQISPFFISSALLTYGGLLAVGFGLYALYASRYNAPGGGSLGVRAAAGLLLAAAAIMDSSRIGSRHAGT